MSSQSDTDFRPFAELTVRAKPEAKPTSVAIHASLMSMRGEASHMHALEKPLVTPGKLKTNCDMNLSAGLIAARSTMASATDRQSC